MIYFGVDLLDHGCSITSLTEGFAVLESKDFFRVPRENIRTWVSSLKNEVNEKSWWFFDEFNFQQYHCDLALYGLNQPYDEIFLVDHRRLINLHKFLNEFPALRGDYFSMKFDMAHLLASSARLFSSFDIKLHKMENLSLIG